MTPLYITHDMRSKNLVTAAKAYAKGGIPVLALWGVDDDGNCRCGKLECTSAGKHPITEMFPRGLKNATTSISDIRRVWKAYPKANIGLVIEEGLFVIDLDAKGNEDAGRRIAAFNLPATPYVSTGRGKHLYFHWQGDGLPPRIAKVDYRHSAKGYVVAPPSRHASGVSYRWHGARTVANIPPTFFTTTSHAGRGNAAIIRETEYFEPEASDWRAVIKKYQTEYSHSIRRLMKHDRVRSPDRSKCIFLIASALFKAGATDNEVASVVWRSPYFQSKYGENYTRLAEELTRIKTSIERGASR